MSGTVRERDWNTEHQHHGQRGNNITYQKFRKIYGKFREIYDTLIGL